MCACVRVSRIYFVNFHCKFGKPVHLASFASHETFNIRCVMKCYANLQHSSKQAWLTAYCSNNLIWYQVNVDTSFVYLSVSAIAKCAKQRRKAWRTPEVLPLCVSKLYIMCSGFFYPFVDVLRWCVLLLFIILALSWFTREQLTKFYCVSIKFPFVVAINRPNFCHFTFFSVGSNVIK